jgi:hypothetical protein
MENYLMREPMPTALNHLMFASRFSFREWIEEILALFD